MDSFLWLFLSFILLKDRFKPSEGLPPTRCASGTIVAQPARVGLPGPKRGLDASLRSAKPPADHFDGVGPLHFSAGVLRKDPRRAWIRTFGRYPINSILL